MVTRTSYYINTITVPANMHFASMDTIDVHVNTSTTTILKSTPSKTLTITVLKYR